MSKYKKVGVRATFLYLHSKWSLDHFFFKLVLPQMNTTNFQKQLIKSPKYLSKNIMYFALRT